MRGVFEATTDPRQRVALTSQLIKASASQVTRDAVSGPDTGNGGNKEIDPNTNQYAGSYPIEPTGASELDPGEKAEKGGVKKGRNPTFDAIMNDAGIRSRLVSLPSHPTTVEVDEIPKKLNFNAAGPNQKNIIWFDTFNGFRAYLMGTASLESHPGVNNAGDALRHAEWSAKMAQSLGVDEAKKISDAYEISHE